MKSEKKVRLAELDLMRFVAALAVMAYHRLVPSVVPTVVYDGAQFGFFGVHLFFMISGFVILWSAMDRPWNQFLASRISRLYPSFWVALLMTTLVLIWGGRHVGLAQFAANATMLPNAFHQEKVDSVYWTLNLEIRFYALVFALVLFRQMQRVEWYLAGWLAACVVQRYLVPALEPLTLMGFAPYFIAGCVFFLIRRSGYSAARLGMLAVALPFMVDLGIVSVHNSATRFETPYLTLYGIVIVLALFALFFSFARQTWRLPDSKVWGWLGAMTYPLYLVHDEIGNVLWEKLEGIVTPATSLLLISGTALGLAFALAATTERHACPAMNRFLTACWAAAGARRGRLRTAPLASPPPLPGVASDLSQRP